MGHRVLQRDVGNMAVSIDWSRRWVCSKYAPDIEGEASDCSVMIVYRRSKMISGPEPKHPSWKRKVGNCSQKVQHRIILKPDQEPSEGHQNGEQKCPRLLARKLQGK